jgi:hypothetical protein
MRAPAMIRKLRPVIATSAALLIIALASWLQFAKSDCSTLARSRAAKLRTDARAVAELDLSAGSENYVARRGDPVFDCTLAAIGEALNARCGQPAEVGGIRVTLPGIEKNETFWVQPRRVVIDGMGFRAPGELVERAFSEAVRRATMWYASGVRRATGQWANYKRVGHWKFYWKSGALWREGDYMDGRQVGRWVEYSPEGVETGAKDFGKNDGDGKDEGEPK